MFVMKHSFFHLLVMALALFGLYGCDAGPSAVLPDHQDSQLSPPAIEQPLSKKDAKNEDGAPQETTKKEPTTQEATIPDTALEQTFDDKKAAPSATSFLTFIDKSQSLTDTHYGKTPLWSSTRDFSARENAYRHFEKHAQELGIGDFKTYVGLAHGFTARPPPKTEILKRPNGDRLYYHASSNLFAVTTKTGAPRTIFQPYNGQAYWQKQKDTINKDH